MAHAVAKLKALATVFGLCTECENKLTCDSEDGAGSAQARTCTPQNDVSYSRSTLDGVRMKDCDMQNVQIKNCKLTDVTFEKCRFKDVVLDGLELNGFTFYSLDLTKVRVKDGKLPGFVWSHQEVANAFVAAASFVCADGCTIAVSKPPGSVSKTMVRCLSYTDTAEGPRLPHTTGSTHAIVSTPVPLLDMPEAILDRMVSYVFPSDGVYDWITIDQRLAKRHEVSAQTTFQSYYLGTTLTYKLKRGNPYARATSAAAGSLLYLNRRINAIATRYLYSGRYVSFIEPEVCLAFLHEHRAPKYQLRKMKLWLQPSTRPST